MRYRTKVLELIVKKEWLKEIPLAGKDGPRSTIDFNMGDFKYTDPKPVTPSFDAEVYAESQADNITLSSARACQIARRLSAQSDCGPGPFVAVWMVWIPARRSDPIYAMYYEGRVVHVRGMMNRH